MRKAIGALLAAATSLATAGAARAEAKFSPHMTSLTIGAGASQFVRRRLGDEVSTAVSWDARLVIGTRTPIAFELEYLGSLAKEHDPFAGAFPAGAKLTTSQVGGNARFNLLRGRVQPFFTAGAGWINFHSFSRDVALVAASHFRHDANAAVFPFGAGLAGYFGRHAVIEARASYELVTGAREFTNQPVRPDLWVAQLSGGWAF